MCTKNDFIRKSQVQIFHTDPRRLLAHIAHPALQCHVFAMHAPQSGRPLEERKRWRTETQEITHRYCQNIPLFVLIDANAKSGPKCEPVVFEIENTCSASTGLFCDHHQTQQLCLPSTSMIHQGPTATWMSPDGHQGHRIDFVAIL